MKNKHDGWSMRRRNQRDKDRIARDAGYADNRTMLHARSVEELQRFLCLPDAWLDPLDGAGSKLYETRVVADAIGTRPKAVRWFAYTRQLVSEPPRGEKSRKLFFSADSVRGFLRSRRTLPFSQVLRHAAIAANPRGVGELGLTKSEVAHELAISKRAVERYLASGRLKRTGVSSRQLTLISYESVRDLEHRLNDDLRRARKKFLRGSTH